MLKRLIRWSFWVLFFFCSRTTFGEGSSHVGLVLIQPAISGPQVDPNTYFEGKWVKWPLPSQASGLNRLLSVTSGLNWILDPGQARYRNEPGFIKPSKIDSLEVAGYFQARDANLGTTETWVLENSVGGVSVESLVLCLNKERQIRRVKFEGKYPNSGICIYQAESWDRIVELSHRFRGRLLVVEYPPKEGNPWARYWLYGTGWPEGIPAERSHSATGLIHAANLARLVLSPNEFSWKSDDSLTWGGANRWFQILRSKAPIVQFLCAVGLSYAVVYGMILVIGERRGITIAVILRGFLLLPAAYALTGNLAHLTGSNTWMIWLPLAELLLLLFSSTLGTSIRILSPDASNYLGIAIVGWVVTTLSDPTLSVFSPVFGLSEPPVPPELLGSWFGYTVLLASGLSGTSIILEWAFRMLCVAMVVIGAITATWWAPSPWPYCVLPIEAFLVGEGAIPTYAIPGFLVLNLHRILAGISWKPNGCLSDLHDLNMIDGSGYITALVSPLSIATVSLAALIGLFGNRFIFRQLRRLIIEDPRRKVAYTAPLALVFMGVFEPVFLTAGLWCGIGGFIVLLHDAVSVL